MPTAEQEESLRTSHVTAASVIVTPLQVGGKSKVLDAFIDLIAGSLGGAANVFVGQPLDTVKVKMQTFPTLYTGTMNCCIRTYTKEGIRGFYAGTVPSLVANVAENSVLFAAYGVCQKFVQVLVQKESVSKLTVLENAFSGFFAAFFSGLALCPTELVKCRLQAMMEVAASKGLDSHPRIGPWLLTRQILHQEGVPGFFRGLTATLMREMPGYFVFFGSYEMAREVFRKPGKTKDEIGLVPTIICGGIGGMSLWTLIFPADVVKSRIQVTSSRISFTETLFCIVRNEGVRPLYSGLLPTLIRTFPSTGALFVMYEYSKRYLHYLTQ